MRWVALWVVAACQFDANGARDGGPARDAPHTDAPRGDAAPDAPRDATHDAPPFDAFAGSACHVAPASGSGSGSDAGKVGISGGGGTRDWLSCTSGSGSGGVIVGIAIELSNQPANGTPFASAHTIAIACGDVTIDGSGAHSTLRDAVELSVPPDNTDHFTPATLSPLGLCAPGAVASGLTVHGKTNTPVFQDGTVGCTEVSRTGETAAAGSAAIPMSGSGAPDVSALACPPGQEITGLYTNHGGGLDSLDLFCSPARCE